MCSKTVQPCLSEILRTCVYPSSALLKVEKVLQQQVSFSVQVGSEDGTSSKSSNETSCSMITRLLLSDGVFVMQAYLEKHLQQREGFRKLESGDFINVRQFDIKKAKRQNGHGVILYLSIRDCDFIFAHVNVESELGGGFIPDGVNVLSTRSTTKRKRPDEISPDADEALEGGFLRIDEEWPATKQKHIDPNSETASPPPPLNSRKPSSQLEIMKQTQDSDDEGFETAKLDLPSAQKRRRALHEINQNATTRSFIEQPHATLTRKARHQALAGDTFGVSFIKPNPPLSKPRTSIPIPPSPYHTLLSLQQPDLNLPAKYHCSIFGVVSWISPTLIHRPGSLFPPKRHLRIHDMSLQRRAEGITLFVFAEPKTFQPVVGTVALFRGLRVQRWDDEVILNAYQGLAMADQPWFVDEYVTLESLGFEPDKMKSWWETDV